MVKEERSQKLIELSNQNEIEYNKTYVGKEVEVLIEEKKDEYYKGHTQNYILAYIKSDKNLENTIIKAKCQKAQNAYIMLDSEQCNKNVIIV